jgi:hypothetical protein
MSGGGGSRLLLGMASEGPHALGEGAGCIRGDGMRVTSIR